MPPECRKRRRGGARWPGNHNVGRGEAGQRSVQDVPRHFPKVHGLGVPVHHTVDGLQTLVRVPNPCQAQVGLTKKKLEGNPSCPCPGAQLQHRQGGWPIAEAVHVGPPHGVSCPGWRARRRGNAHGHGGGDGPDGGHRRRHKGTRSGPRNTHAQPLHAHRHQRSQSHAKYMPHSLNRALPQAAPSLHCLHSMSGTLQPCWTTPGQHKCTLVSTLPCEHQSLFNRVDT